jgi:hypothetical protein
MRKLIYLLLIVSFPVFVLAQQKTITGKVTDAEGGGAALSGVTVSVGGVSGTGTITNAEGIYSVIVPASAKELVFSFAGMKTITEQINGRTVINIQMAAGDDQLSNVVVVGYTSQRKETLTGAVSVIKGSFLTP